MAEVMAAEPAGCMTPADWKLRETGAIGLACGLQDPSSSNFLVKVPELSKIVAPARDQVFKQVNAWGILYIETILPGSSQAPQQMDSES